MNDVAKVLIALFVGVAAGLVMAEEPAPETPEVVAPEPEIRRVEVAPDECAEAIQLARDNFRRAGRAIGVLSDGMGMAGEAVQAASVGDLATLDSIEVRVNRANARLNDLNAKLTVTEFQEAAAACESA